MEQNPTEMMQPKEVRHREMSRPVTVRLGIDDIPDRAVDVPLLADAFKDVVRDGGEVRLAVVAHGVNPGEAKVDNGCGDALEARSVGVYVDQDLAFVQISVL